MPKVRIDDYHETPPLEEYSLIRSAMKYIQVVTTTVEQESWLILRFGEKAKHFSTIYNSDPITDKY